MLTIISEIGINWDGNISLMEELIRQSKFGGADLIKLQLYSSQKLFGDDSRINNEISKEQLSFINNIASSYEIELFASVFDTERLHWCEELGFQKYKIASRTLKYDKGLCEKILSLNKPTYISLGMGNEQLISPNDQTIFFRCCSEYPTTIDDLKKTHFMFHGDYLGYSCHGYGISNSLYAISQGAKFIEKHFTLDKSDNYCRDHIGSMNLDELKILASYGRELERVSTKFKGDING